MKCYEWSIINEWSIILLYIYKYINVNFHLCDHWVIHDPNAIKFSY